MYKVHDLKTVSIANPHNVGRGGATDGRGSHQTLLQYIPALHIVTMVAPHGKMEIPDRNA